MLSGVLTGARREVVHGQVLPGVSNAGTPHRQAVQGAVGEAGRCCREAAEGTWGVASVCLTGCCHSAHTPPLSHPYANARTALARPCRLSPQLLAASQVLELTSRAAQSSRRGDASSKPAACQRQLPRTAAPAAAAMAMQQREVALAPRGIMAFV